MHIAYITSEYASPRVSHAAGIGTSIKNLAVALVAKGHQVTVVVYNQNETACYMEAGVSIHLIAKKQYAYFTWFYYRKQINRYVNALVASQKIDIVEAPDWTGITAFMRFKVPLVIRLHGSDGYFCKLENRRQKFKNFVFEKYALKGATAYIAPTSYAGMVTAKLFGLKPAKIKTIHYGLELSKFTNAHPSQFSKYRLLYIGTIIRKKGVFELAAIFNDVVAKQPEATLTLIGRDSPDIKTGAASTYELITSLFTPEALKRVSYLGSIPYSQVKDEIKAAHVCAFPSFAETLGMVTIESMALQKPVVNTNIGWAQELIKDGRDGFLVHPTDVSLYAESIITLFQDAALCEKIGKQARAQVEALFDIEKNADINIAYYKSLRS